MKKYLVLAAAFLCAATISNGQQMQNLPNDPETRVGQLDNGLTYYIRHNDKPAQRAEFYLATDVGAIQEAPDQDGLAHFLEHMCFNGTKNFPDKGILDYLESIGASFGGNVNAATGVEQTTYMLNNIPLVRPGVVDTCILIMHDYSHFVLCDPKEIDAERGVILEEKRSRNTAGWRMHMASNKYIYGDTPYATCSLIGSEEQLKTFKPESLTNFYHTWYRPDNQALIVVGDINVDEVEAKIASIFSDIPAPENPKAKETIKIPDNEDPIVGVITDKECTSTSLAIFWKSERAPEMLNSTGVGLTTRLLKAIISMVLDERLSDIAAKPDAPFIYAYTGIGKLCESMDVVLGQTSCKDGEATKALEAFLTETEKMKRFGFTDAEIERAKNNILSSYESAAKKADTRKNSEFIDPMIENFFDNESFLAPDTAYQLVQMLMPQLQPAIINQVAQSLITDENMVVVMQAPEKEGLTNPSEDELRSVIYKVRQSEIENAGAEDVPTEFLDTASLKAAKIKGKAKPYIYGSELYKLSNGMKVILYPTDIQKDQINIDVYKRGGKSLISDSDLYSFEESVWSLFIQNSGLSDFSATTLTKMLAGKNLSVTPFISSYTHGLELRSTPKDLETALQCANLYFTDPRFDIDEYNQGINQIMAVLPNLEQQSNYKLQEQMYKTVYDSPRRILVSGESVGKASLETMGKVYRELYDGADGATVVVVGDFSKEEVLPMIQKYLGSVKKGAKPADWAYRGDGFVKENKLNDFKARMETPMVTVLQLYNVDKPYSVETEVCYDALEYILGMVYVATLREDEGGTYGAHASSMVSNAPYEARVMQVSFQTNVDQADRLRELAVEGLKKIAEDGPAADDYDKTISNMLKKIPESRLRLSYWLNNIEKYEKFGYDYDKDYEAAVNALTPEKVKATAAEILNEGNLVELVMRPEE